MLCTVKDADCVDDFLRAGRAVQRADILQFSRRRFAEFVRQGTRQDFAVGEYSHG